jgi:ribose transport system ATP-binding protein
VLGLSDRILVIADGSVVHDGPSEAIDAAGVLDRIIASHEHPASPTEQKGEVA